MLATFLRRPYGILILFMSLAYIAASLDATGVFAWLALHITRASRGRGHLLFFLYYLLSALMTAFTVRGGQGSAWRGAKSTAQWGRCSTGLGWAHTQVTRGVQPRVSQTL